MENILKLNKNTKCLIVNSSNVIVIARDNITEAKLEVEERNEFAGRRKYEWSYAAGHHGFRVVEITEDLDLSKFRIEKSAATAGYLMGNEFFPRDKGIEAITQVLINIKENSKFVPIYELHYAPNKD